jgi:ribosomal-protein-alanine N-acetyltransferase
MPIADTIHVERCSLFRLDACDREDVAAIHGNENVRRYLGGPVRGPVFEQKFDHLLSGIDGTHWVIRDRTAGRFMGLVALSRHHDGHDVELSYQLLPAFWGKGFATEAVGAVVQHALGALRLPRLLAETQAANHRSRRLLEKLGMTAARSVVRFGAEQIVYQRMASRDHDAPGTGARLDARRC